MKTCLLCKKRLDNDCFELLRDIDDLYDGKIDYITEVLKKIDRNKSLGLKTESLIKEFVKI